MSWVRKIVFGYLAIVSIIFLAGYVVFGIREMGLYLFLIFINLPISLVVVPQMESLSESLGWILGRPAHILATQLVCMAVNSALLTAIVAIAFKLWRSSRGAAVRPNPAFECGRLYL